MTETDKKYKVKAVVGKETDDSGTFYEVEWFDYPNFKTWYYTFF